MTADVLGARAPWYVAGPLIGLLIVLLLWVTNQPLGALGGYIELAERASGKRAHIGWRTFFMIGVIVGGFVSCLGGTGWHPTLDYGSFDDLLGSTLLLKAGVLFTAGILMGSGGRTAGGCTSGHGLCGTACGSPASFLCTATFMTTAIACAFTVGRLFGV